MSKLTKFQKEELKSLVAKASIRRLTAKETSAFVLEQLGFTISEDHIRRVRMYIKQDSAKELALLTKDRDYYLQRMFWDRLAELEYQQKVLHDVIDRNKDNPDATIKAVHELSGITTDMAQQFINLPAANTLSIPIPIDSNVMQQRLERGHGQERDNRRQLEPDWRNEPLFWGKPGSNFDEYGNRVANENGPLDGSDQP